eukprot:TRINITY_DN26982_c0_g1_i1.p1 TRINITY_DN26982_c0_g1~~TRINITY_DN26982_c0_g1_i1.p1  ORF type:complete len:551 (-),score=110.31 TRINITY_DN26982_c0_g1_i1:154-1806(-)
MALDPCVKKFMAAWKDAAEDVPPTSESGYVYGAADELNLAMGAFRLRRKGTGVETTTRGGSGAVCFASVDSSGDGTSTSGCSLPNRRRALTFTTLVRTLQSLRKCSSPTARRVGSCAAAVLEASEGDRMGRSVTCVVEGPCAGLIKCLSTLEKSDSSYSLLEVCRSDFRNLSCPFASNDGENGVPPPATKPETTSPAAGTRGKLKRLGTIGNLLGESKRERLVKSVTEAEERVQRVSIDNGQTGTVFALEVAGKKVAVFKPSAGESFKRASLSAGQGATREEAAYLVDRLCGSQARVPVTSRATVDVDGTQVVGSVQEFIAGAIGFIEDYGMPRDPERAKAFVKQEAAEALALLDIRIFNMDRHGGNLLLLGGEPPHTLGPIDHGCSLPVWWSLSEAVFDAWIDWSHLQCEPCAATRDLAQKAVATLPEVCKMLEDSGLEPQAVVTLRLCTLLVQVAVGELALPVGRVAALLCRDDETGFQDLSWLERKVQACSEVAGCPCRVEKDNRGDERLVVEDEGDSLDVDAFLGALGTVFRQELPEAVRKSKRPG